MARPESILLLLFKRIAGTRHVGLDDVPTLMDEYDYYEDVYFGKVTEDNPAKITKIKGIYEFINKLQPPKEPDIHIPYRLSHSRHQYFPSDDDAAVKKSSIVYLNTAWLGEQH